MEWENGKWIRLQDGRRAMMCTREGSAVRALAFEDGIWALSDAYNWRMARPARKPAFPEPLPEPGDVIEGVSGELWVIQECDDTLGNFVIAEPFPTWSESTQMDDFKSTSELMKVFEPGWKNLGNIRDLVERGRK